jgi:hypothetical protein
MTSTHPEHAGTRPVVDVLGPTIEFLTTPSQADESNQLERALIRTWPWPS